MASSDPSTYQPPEITTPIFSLTISPASTIHPTAKPTQPLYYLPTSLSVHGLTLNISQFHPSILTARDRSVLSDPHHKLFTISRIPTTDTYTFVSHVVGRQGKGIVRWVGGLLWGGTWEVDFILFDESVDRDRKLKLKLASGDTRWMFSEEEVPPGTALQYPEDSDVQPPPPPPQSSSSSAMVTEEILVAEEQPVEIPEGEENAGAERGETIMIHTGKAEVTDVVRETITVAWVTKCWSERTKTGWFSKSARDKTEWAGGLKYRW